jgi:hypothetical protein
VVLVVTIEDWFVANIVEFDRAHQMWTFLRDFYEPTRQSTYLAVIRQEQLLQHGNAAVDDFFDQLSAI